MLGNCRRLSRKGRTGQIGTGLGNYVVLEGMDFFYFVFKGIKEKTRRVDWNAGRRRECDGRWELEVRRRERGREKEL